MTDPPQAIDCIDCGGTAHLLSYLPADQEVELGTALAYRCGDCMERFDVIWESDESD